jgi:hypothetical protein
MLWHEDTDPGCEAYVYAAGHRADPCASGIPTRVDLPLWGRTPHRAVGGKCQFPQQPTPAADSGTGGVLRFRDDRERVVAVRLRPRISGDQTPSAGQ